MNTTSDWHDLQSFKDFIENKFETVNIDLIEANIDFKSDLELSYGNDVYNPIEDFLGFPLARRFGRYGVPTHFAALIRNEDGSAWQSILSIPDERKSYTRRAPKGIGDRAFLPSLPATIRKKISDRFGVEVPLSGSFWEWFKNTSLPLTITEGAEKALSLLSQAIPAISLYGCTCGVNNKDLDSFTRSDRIFLIGFDRDTKPKAKAAVHKGIRRLVSKLSPNKAAPLYWQSEQGKGIDDFIFNQGREALDRVYARGLIDAVNYDPVITESDFYASKIVDALNVNFDELKDLFSEPDKKYTLQSCPQTNLNHDIQYYQRGEAIETYKFLYEQGYEYILDTSSMGSGKSFTVGEVTPQGIGMQRIYYASPSHRNPSVEGIETNYSDLPSRNQGLYRDDEKLTPAGNPHLRHPKNEETSNVIGNCKRASLFHTLEAYGYSEYLQDGDNPICGTCRFRANCTVQDLPRVQGYTFRRDRFEALKSDRVRGHLSTIPRNDSHTLTALFIDECSQIQNYLDTEISLQDFDRAISDYLELNPDKAEDLKHLLPLRKLLSDGCSNFHGLNHLEIHQLIKSDIDISFDNSEHFKSLLNNSLVETDSIRKSDLEASDRSEISSTTLAYVRSVMRSEADKESTENFANLPKPILSKLHSVARNEGRYVIRFSQKGKKLILTEETYEHQKIIQSHNLTVGLDSTETRESFAQKIGVSPDKVAVTSTHPPKYKNLIVSQVKGLGYLALRSNQKSSRVSAIKDYYLNRDGADNVGIIDYLKYTDNSNSQGYWFLDNRATNKFKHKKTLLLFGIPHINIGSLQNKFYLQNKQAFLSGQESFESDRFKDFVKSHWQSEVVQAIGRPRSHLRPNEEVEVVLISDEDLSFLSPYFPEASMRQTEAYQLTPKAGTQRQQNNIALLEAYQQLRAFRDKITQKSIATLAGLNQSTISRILRDIGGFSGLEKLCASLFYIYRVPHKNEWRDTDPSNYVETIATLDASTLLDELALLIQSTGIREVQRFLATCSGNSRVRYLLALCGLLPQDAQEKIIYLLQRT